MAVWFFELVIKTPYFVSKTAKYGVFVLVLHHSKSIVLDLTNRFPLDYFHIYLQIFILIGKIVVEIHFFCKINQLITLVTEVFIMSNIYPSILEKLAALNIDIFHYEDIVCCYVLAKLNIMLFRSPCPQPKRCSEALLML